MYSKRRGKTVVSRKNLAANINEMQDVVRIEKKMMKEFFAKKEKNNAIKNVAGSAQNSVKQNYNSYGEYEEVSVKKGPARRQLHDEKKIARLILALI